MAATATRSRKHWHSGSRSRSSSTDNGEIDPKPTVGRRYSARQIRALKSIIRDEMKLRDWHALEYYKLPEDALETEMDNLPRIAADSLTIDEFRERYEMPNIPVMLTGVTKDWAAPRNWQMDRMLERYGDKTFDVGSSGHTYITLGKYVKYMEATKDDCPLYAFEPKFADNYPELAREYQTPRFFEDDYYSYMGEKPRPYYRWILMGGIRTGGGIHQDPFNTSAWNTLLSGRKRWVLFPPSTSDTLLKLPKEMDDNSISWYRVMYPKLAPRAAELGMIEFVQHPLETVFVPYGWWHVVVNLEFTVSVTANYAGRVNFKKVFKSYKKKFPRRARRWYNRLPASLKDEVSPDGLSSRSSTSSSSSSSSTSVSVSGSSTPTI